MIERIHNTLDAISNPKNQRTVTVVGHIVHLAVWVAIGTYFGLTA